MISAEIDLSESRLAFSVDADSLVRCKDRSFEEYPDGGYF